MDFETVPVVFYRVKERSLAEIIKESDYRKNIDWNRLLQVVLHLNLSADSQVSGMFKITSFGMAGEPLFGNGTRDICVKQIFTTKTREVPNGKGQMVRVQQKVAVDKQAQAAAMGLMTEVNCLSWSKVMLKMTYQFINQALAASGIVDLPFEIPRMRFVDAGLAWEQREGRNRIFLVEELISKDKEGIFRKYLHNGSAYPCYFGDNDDGNQAEFLAFSQHVQYWKTGKLVFVTDYQGRWLKFITVSSMLTRAVARGRYLII